MSDQAIRVLNLGKQYRVGGLRASYGTLRDTIAAAARAPLRWARGRREQERRFWALREVSFEVGRGEVIGIIGRNGAGKSTLLKILSRITAPSEGRVELRGRVGTLLEVGTGFHPELSGRENIFLNGAILGMRRGEIERKFDEIVQFAEVERFIDTPVKHYSSGMYLRLAFAVAAHLEPDILIVDEVLAVGDAAFQRKCLGKMGEVAGEGRTVLFVSHNMQAIAQLTRRCVVLERGACRFDGPTGEAIRVYHSDVQPEGAATYQADPQPGRNQIRWARVQTSEEGGRHRWGQPVGFEFALQVAEPKESMCFSFQVVNAQQQPVCHMWLFDAQPYRTQPGTYLLRCQVPMLRLYMGAYTLTTYLSERRGNTALETLSGICPFEVTMEGTEREEYDWAPDTCAYLEDQRWLPVEQLAE